MLNLPLLRSTIALLQFFVNSFPGFDWYPYWYLGNPYFYLSGPVIPVIVNLLQYQNINTSQGYIVLLFLSIFICGLGIYSLLVNFDIEKKMSGFAALFFILFPASYMVLQYQDGLKHITLASIPFLLIAYKRFLRSHKLRYGLVTILLILLILLINTSLLLTVCISLLALLFSLQLKDFKENIFKLVIIILLGISISTFWYTPGYWWTILINPSIAGIPLLKLITVFLQGALQLMPLIISLWVIKMKRIKFSGFKLFSILFTFSFLFLSLIRLVSDPDFYIDWTGFAPEIQMGFAFMIGAYSKRVMSHKYTLVLVAIMVALFHYYMVTNNNVTMKQFNNEEDAYKTRITSILTKYIPKSERVFLSGSSVFWINARDSIMQVRGGNDRASIHRWWAHGAYQVREGRDPSLTHAWLKILGASYILVNDSTSEEYFNDFKHIEKFEQKKYFTPVYSKSGDHLYKVTGSSMGRIADTKIIELQSPKHGADKEAIFNYLNVIKRNVSLRFNKSNELTVVADILENEVISLAVSYDHRWRIMSGEAEIITDSVSNIVIVPRKAGKQEFVLRYSRNNLDWIIGIIVTCMLGLVLVYFKKIYPVFLKISLKLHLGQQEDENDY